MNWYIKVLSQYTDFQGRARRKEYWMFSLINFIVLLIAIGLDNALGLTFNDSFYGVIYSIYGLLVFLPSLAVSVRRLHDIGKSGWMILLQLIPIIGAIWLLILLITDSDIDTNKYGVNPKS